MRRESLWLFVSPVRSILAAPNTAVIQNTLNATALGFRPFTVVRTRGYMRLATDAEGANEAYDASLGYAVVSDQATAVGATAVPTPETDRGSDLWFVYETIAGIHELTSDIGKLVGGDGKDYDSRAMRKVEEGEDIVVVIETSAISLGCTFYNSARMLIKLH